MTTDQRTPPDHHDAAPFPRFVGEVRQWWQFLRSSWSSEMAHAVVAELAPEPGWRVLDLGAGLGAMSILAAERVGRAGSVLAVDPSAAMRRVMQVRLALGGHRHDVEVVDGRGETLPLADATVDAVCSLNVLHHLDDLDRATVELARVVRPGGRLVLVDEHFTHPDHPASGAGAAGVDPHFVDLDDLVARLTRAGFDAQGEHRRLGGVPAFVVVATARDREGRRTDA